MSTFNMTRFGKVMKWSLWHDKSTISKIFLRTLATLALIVLFFMLIERSAGNQYGMNLGAFSAIIVCSFLFMGTYLYYGFQTQSDWQQFLTLPGSNLEKFLSRYGVSLIIMLGMWLSVVIVDGVQYVISMIVRPGEGKLIVNELCRSISVSGMFKESPKVFFFFMGQLVFIHSLYLLGASFFRSRKHSWVLTTLIIIVVGTVLGVTIAHQVPNIEMTESLLDKIGFSITAVYWILAIFNIWLSYRLFTRRQLIGRFINC
ncbi:MAG: hypothetical protein IKZ93_06360 [Prevotella sp.]|nr:hypothetical protein [Prevotella sp.]